jgi:UPF0755 protein
MTRADPASPQARRRRRRVAGAAVVLVVLVAVLGAALFGWYTARLNRPFQGYPAGEQFVEVPSGLGVTAIGRRLVAAGVVPDLLTYRLAVRMRRGERSLKAGEYRFDRPLSPLAVVDRLVRGDVYLRAITFPEGLTIRDMAERFELGGFGPAGAFHEAARDASLVRGLDPHAPDLEGYLFPDTYRLPRQASAADLVREMVRRFEEVFGEAHRAAAAARGLSVREVVTLASLVEKETALAEERPIVAGVYANRLRIGMGLQCDPTVIYALQRAGRWNGNLTRADLAYESPYNTYRYAGLPPGPIAAPGKGALDAALAPAGVPYLYFVSRNDGSHVFSTTLREHNAAVRQYQILYFREKRMRERSQAALGPS